MPANSAREKKALAPDRSAAMPTRDRILDYLKQHRVASVQELSRDWGLTRADIRYHFNTLAAEGLIEQAPRDPGQPARRGRPQQSYRLAAGSAPGNLPALCSALLDTLMGTLAADESEPALRALAVRLASSSEPPPGLTQRLNQTISFLNQHGYLARWEARASGPQISLRSCPYAAILPAHPELCALDRYLLEQLARVPLLQTARINLSGSSPAACLFTTRLES